MDKTILTLCELRDKAKEAFINNSIIKHQSSLESPVPDTDSYLRDIIELNEAIHVLQKHATVLDKDARNTDNIVLNENRGYQITYPLTDHKQH